MVNKIKFSDKIVLLSFILSIGVVYQHTQLRYNGNEFVTLLKDFMFYLVEVCVPCFFMISGYLFYRTFSMKKLMDKYKSRARSLLVPYLVWNVIYCVCMVILYRLGFIHELDVPQNGGVLYSIVNSNFSPLWFVKYLMIFALFSPILYILIKNKYLGIFVLMAMIIYNAFAYRTGIMQIPLNINANNFTMLNYQLIFYMIGAYAALHLKLTVETGTKQKAYISICVIVILIAIYFIWLRNHGDAITSHTFRIIFSIALWFAMDMMPEIKIKWWMKISFFIYCAHLLPLQCMQKVSEIIINHIPYFKAQLMILEYIFLPILVVMLVIFIAWLLKRYALVLWNIITGSRG